MTKIVIYGYVRDKQKSKGASPERIDEEIEIDANISEAEAVALIQSKLVTANKRMFRSASDSKAGRDKVSVIAGIDTDGGMRYKETIQQPRDPTTGRFISYAEYGRQLLREAGETYRKNPTTGKFMTLKEIGQAASTFVTGERYRDYKGIDYLNDKLDEILR